VVSAGEPGLKNARADERITFIYIDGADDIVRAPRKKGHCQKHCTRECRRRASGT